MYQFLRSKKWHLCLTLLFLVATYPFYIQLFMETDTIYTFNMPLQDFISTWLTLWGLVGAAIGIYQVQHKIELTKKKQDAERSYQQDLLTSQHKQLKLQAEQMQRQTQIVCNARYDKFVEFLENNSGIIRLTAINGLYKLAQEHPDQFLESVCNTFCKILCENSQNSTNTTLSVSVETKEILKLLFMRRPLIFDSCTKILINCHLSDIRFVKADISNTYFMGSSFTNCSFHHVVINESLFNNAQFKSVLFRSGRIKHTNLKKTEISDTHFERMDLYVTSFLNAEIVASNFMRMGIDNCDFTDAQIKDSQFLDTKFSHNSVLEAKNIRNSNFTFPDNIQRDRFITLFTEEEQNTMQIENNIIHFN